MEMYIHILIVTLLVCPSCGFYYTYSVNQSNAPLREITINKNTGTVYIGGRNILAYLSENLTELSSVSLGPVNDSKYCEPRDAACSSKVRTDNTVDILLWLSGPIQNGTHVLGLIVCGTAHQGMCELRDINNISAVEKTCGGRYKYNLLGTETNSILLPYFINGTWSFFSTHSWDGRDPKYFPDEFSLLEMENNTHWVGKKCWEFDRYARFSSAKLTNKSRTNANIKFVYSFDNNTMSSYIYNVYTRAGLTRIVRICKHDKYMHSLTEFSLKCDTYNIATGAYFDPIGGNLYVAFGVGAGDSVNEPTDTMMAKVCVYPLRRLHQEFQEKINECYTDKKGFSPPRWSDDNSQKCTEQKVRI